MSKSFLIIGLLFSAFAWGASETEDLQKLEAEAPASTTEAVSTEEPEESGVPTLQVGLAMDTLYSGGGAQSQGFSLPLARLSVFGDLTPSMAYRFSLGQTREFSSSLLPQLLPVEAFVDVYSADRDNEPELQLRAGMFTPNFNPWWTPDLGQLEIPDYAESHRALFLGRDLGAEIRYRHPGQRFEMGAGTCNGSGILSLNTNNSKAVTGFTSYQMDWGSVKLLLGGAYYLLSQSTTGSLNYKKSEVLDFYLGLRAWERFELGADVFSASYSDSARTLEPKGFSVLASIGITKKIALLARAEHLTASPVDGNVIRGYLIGPTFEWSPGFKSFVYFKRQESGGGTEDTFQVRVRVRL